MSAQEVELLGEDRGGGMKVEVAEWQPNREVTLEALHIVDMIHEGKPQCRLCGQVVNRLDQFGLCSKTSDAHQERRGITPKKKAARR